MCCCGCCSTCDIYKPCSFVYRNVCSGCCDPVLDCCDGTTLTKDLNFGDRGAAYIYKKGTKYPYPLQKRYAVITDGKLMVYKNSSRLDIKNQLSLIGAKVVESNYSEYAKYKLTIYFPGTSSSMSLISSSVNEGVTGSNSLNDRTIYLGTRKQVRLWREAIEAEAKFLQLQGSKNGFLLKKGGGLMTKWQKRWCHLSGGKLEYFEEGLPSPKGTISVMGGNVRRTNDNKTKSFEISGFDPTTHKTIVREFRCSDEQNREEWVQAIEKQITYRSFEVLYKEQERQDIIQKEEKDKFLSVEGSNSTSEALLPEEHDRVKLLKPKPMETKNLKENMNSGSYSPPSPSISPSSQSETEMVNVEPNEKALSNHFDKPKPPKIEGFLSKVAGTGISRYQKRYFTLHYPGIVKYYKGEPKDKKYHTDQKALGFINLFDVVDEGITVQQMDILINVDTRIFRLRCSDKQQRDDWFTCLRDWVVYSKEYIEWTNERKILKKQQETGSFEGDNESDLNEAIVVHEQRL